MKSCGGTPMIVSSCEPPENVFSIRIPNNMCHCDPASVLHRFVRRGLAGNTQQRAGWEFSRVTPSARVLSLRMVWSDRSHRRDSLYQTIERQISTRRYRPNHWLRTSVVETGCHPTRRCELPNVGSHRN